jgi:hypothetical protein
MLAVSAAGVPRWQRPRRRGLYCNSNPRAALNFQRPGRYPRGGY